MAWRLTAVRAYTPALSRLRYEEVEQTKLREIVEEDEVLFQDRVKKSCHCHRPRTDRADTLVLTALAPNPPSPLFITPQHDTLNRPQAEEQTSTNTKQCFLVRILKSIIYAISGPLDFINHGQPSYSASNLRSHPA